MPKNAAAAQIAYHADFTDKHRDYAERTTQSGQTAPATSHIGTSKRKSQPRLSIRVLWGKMLGAMGLVLGYAVLTILGSLLFIGCLSSLAEIDPKHMRLIGGACIGGTLCGIGLIMFFIALSKAVQ